MLLRTSLLLSLAAGAAQAADASATLSGARLSVETPCARQVSIEPDPALHDQVVVRASADHEEEIARLVMVSQSGAHLRTVKAGCWRPDISDFSPTLTLSVRVPQGADVSIDEGGTGRYTIGAVGGALALDLSGVGDIEVARVTSVAADISGTGSVHVHDAAGAGKIDISGQGHVTIDQAQFPTLAANMSGAGMLEVGGGQIGTLALDNSGLGVVKLGATVGDANVDISGAGSVRFSKLTGKLEKEVSGAGSVIVDK